MLCWCIYRIASSICVVTKTNFKESWNPPVKLLSASLQRTNIWGGKLESLKMVCARCFHLYLLFDYCKMSCKCLIVSFFFNLLKTSQKTAKIFFTLSLSGLMRLLPFNVRMKRITDISPIRPLWLLQMGRTFRIKSSKLLKLLVVLIVLVVKINDNF